MGALKKLAGQTAIYGLSSILGRSINFLLIIVYTGYLSKADLGAFTGIYALIGFLNIVFTYGMETTFFRFSTGKNQDPHRVYHTTQTLLVLSSLVLGSAVYLAAPLLAEWMNYPGQAYLFQWTALLLAFDAVLAIPFAKLRLENKAKTFAGAKLINILLNVFFNLLFLIWIPSWIQGDLLPQGTLGFQSDWGGGIHPPLQFDCQWLDYPFCLVESRLFYLTPGKRNPKAHVGLFPPTSFYGFGRSDQ